jgi:nucleotide-binding universal stress UspA family protein
MTVVVGYVPDATGLLAIREAAKQAQWRDTELVVVNVVDAAGYIRPTAADEQTLDAVSAQLAEAGARFSLRQVEQPKERVSDELLRVAAEEKAELIVLGLRRRSPIMKAVLGSTAQRVLGDATCPVLLVRADED